MPNTLGHIGVQTPLSRFFFKNGALQWIALGCLIPDIPWIVQRILLKLQLANPYLIGYYVTIQSSLLFSTLLAFVFSSFSRERTRVFLLLLINCCIHLLLDGCEIKWGNGVLFFAPFSWEPVSFNLFWTDHPVHIILTAAGLFSIFFLWYKQTSQEVQLTLPRGVKAAFCLLIFILYLTAPIFFIDQVKQSNIRYLATLQDKKTRTGKTIQGDRVQFSSNKRSLQFVPGEDIQLIGQLPEKASLLSIKGKFITMDTIEVKEFHSHGHSRDWASIIGIITILALWAETLYNQLKRRTFD